jgi:DNA-binding HxlR family transcriptional regulator
MTFPKPGEPVRGSRTGRPVMALLDLLGRRMALRVLWELFRAGAPLTFRALQDAAGTNPALLNTRLKELRVARLAVHRGDGYALSEDGQALVALLLPLTAWADRWAAALKGSGDPGHGAARATSSPLQEGEGQGEGL